MILIKTCFGKKSKKLNLEMLSLLQRMHTIAVIVSLLVITNINATVDSPDKSIIRVPALLIEEPVLPLESGGDSNEVFYK